MSFSAASKCPFIARASASFLQNCGPSLGMYGQKCPVISKLFHTAAGRATGASGKQPLTFEYFFRNVHPKLAKSAAASTSAAAGGGGGGGGVPGGTGAVAGAKAGAGQCPFRAMLQGRGVHTCPHLTGAPQAVPVTTTAAPSSEESRGEGEGGERGGRGGWEDCKCASSGRKPKGNCPFRWKDFLPSSLKDTVHRAVNVRPTSFLDKVPLTGNGELDYDGFFDKKIAEKQRDNSYRKFRVLARSADRFPTAKQFEDVSVQRVEEGRDITVWCSNDYLGMGKHPEVINATIEALKKHGVGAGGTRNISGNSYYHVALERELADLHGKESALVFSSCYVANDATLSTLGKMLPGCVFFSDAGNHNSMIAGIRHATGAKKEIFRHNDPEHLDSLLSHYDPTVPKIVAFESVYSMSGSIAPIGDICEVARRHNALTFIDEVHAVGLYGERGAGIGERDGIADHLDVVSGTLGKAFGVAGGYIAGSARLIDMIRSYADGFIFTTAMPPMQAVAALTSVRVLKSDEGRGLRAKHQESVRRLRGALEEAGLPVVPSPSHIIPLHVGDAKRSTQASQLLMDRYGVYVQDINYPTVARGQEKLRIAPTPFHTPEMQDHFVDSLLNVWHELGLPFTKMEQSCSYYQDYDWLGGLSLNLPVPALA